ncbi:hypothetical protein HKX48_005057 [Thoreauomyces humboldtii]|nr:hypothetical protein HKX48_005057 [Thoreauomyces humboldtii]
MDTLIAAAAACQGESPSVRSTTAATGTGGPTYHGYIASTQDCLLLFEATRVGVLRRIQRRLSEQERETWIRSGSVFVWEEDESGIKRWTDSKNWSPSRITGSFLVYREVDETTARRRVSSIDSDETSGTTRIGRRRSSISTLGSPLLTKKSISVRTKEGGKLHVVCYYTKSDVTAGHLRTPRDDPSLRSLAIRAGLYPEILPEVSLMPSPAPGTATTSAGVESSDSHVQRTHPESPEYTRYEKDRNLRARQHDETDSPPTVRRHSLNNGDDRVRTPRTTAGRATAFVPASSSKRSKGDECRIVTDVHGQYRAHPYGRELHPSQQHHHRQQQQALSTAPAAFRSPDSLGNGFPYQLSTPLPRDDWVVSQTGTAQPLPSLQATVVGEESEAWNGL